MTNSSPSVPLEVSLLPGEQMCLKVATHRNVFIPPLGYFVVYMLIFVIPLSQFGGIFWVLMALLLLLGLLPLANAAVIYFSTNLSVTNLRIIGGVGVIGRKTFEYPLGKINQIKIDRGLFGDRLGYGTLVVEGGGKDRLNLQGIADPVAVRSKINELRERLPAYATIKQ